MSVKIIKNIVEVGINAYNEFPKVIYEKFVQVVDIGPEKIVRNIIFAVVIYEDNNNRFL